MSEHAFPYTPTFDLPFPQFEADLRKIDGPPRHRLPAHRTAVSDLVAINGVDWGSLAQCTHDTGAYTPCPRHRPERYAAVGGRHGKSGAA